jgi:CheY-like chemotaxis protein
VRAQHIVGRIGPGESMMERRRHARISLKGTAIILAGEHAVRGRLVNLAEGGFLATTLITAPARLLGRMVDIELRMDDPLAKWIRVEARVTRISGGSIAVEFNEPRPALIRLVEAMVVASRLRQRVLSVVLIDEDTVRREMIAEGFRAVGCNVVEAPTSLEAVIRLGEQAFEPDLIAVADSVPVASANEMREFIARNHSHVKLVSITNDLTPPSDRQHWLSSGDPTPDLAHRIRHLQATR